VAKHVPILSLKIQLFVEVIHSAKELQYSKAFRDGEKKNILCLG
jgi:hypothetical protein